MKSYIVKDVTVVEGKPVRKGEILKNLTDDEAKPYLARKVIEEIKSSSETGPEMVDAAPSELSGMQHHTKRAAEAETAADKKAGKAEEK